MQPPELRILKHLLAEEDPKRRRQGLREAFDSGPALAVAATQDYVSTCATTRKPWPLLCARSLNQCGTHGAFPCIFPSTVSAFCSTCVS